MAEITAFILIAGCVLAGLVIARAANTVTGETTEEHEGHNLAVYLLFFAVAIVGGVLVF